MKHSLTNKDKAALTGDCSVCGPGVPVRTSGRGFICLESRRSSSRNYKQANQSKVQAAKSASNSSTHRLTLRNGDLDTCAECGEVQPVAWGRGWMCPTIPQERGWNITRTMNVRPRKIDPDLREEIRAAGMHIETTPSELPTETESVVPGWKTLGPGPDISADEWMKRNGHSW